jgi:hypothetical protein
MHIDAMKETVLLFTWLYYKNVFTNAKLFYNACVYTK